MTELARNQPSTDGDPTDRHVETNRRWWDERVPIHLRGGFYDVPGFVGGQRVLDGFQLDAVGDVTGKTLVHLQCHIGLDTLDWARQGARVVGVDFSAPAVEAARRLAGEIGVADRAEFVVADVYGAPEALGGRRFDVVYTGIGAVAWLPDLERWAGTVARLLAPGGVFYIVEFHPITHVFDDERGREVVDDYFRRAPSVFEEPGTYADRDAATTSDKTVEWHHGLGEIVTALAGAGLRIDFLREYDFTKFQRFAACERRGGYRFPEGAPRVPLMFAIRARA